MENRQTVLCIVGARPNFMKIGPIMRALRAQPRLHPVLVHTGQHYDAAMKQSFFDQLQIPEPNVDLNVGSGSHAAQTGQIMQRFEPVLDRYHPSAVLVVGDVNSTIACALVAVKKDIPVVHVEAGLRSYDRGMPEEINRMLTDQISDLLFTTERSAHDNLAREGIAAERVHFVGNVMIDTLRAHLPRAVPAEKTLVKHQADFRGEYGVITMHRPSNVDDPDTLENLLRTLRRISDELPLVFPLHPRTRARIEENDFAELLVTPRIATTAPLGYLEMLGLTAQARIIITDSGGLQEESTALGVPCLTIRESTERPITVEQGTNTVVGVDPMRILTAFSQTMRNGGKRGRVPELWDGHAAERIAVVLDSWLAERDKTSAPHTEQTAPIVSTIQ